jgi:hypothetical protein
LNGHAKKLDAILAAADGGIFTGVGGQFCSLTEVELLGVSSQAL